MINSTPVDTALQSVLHVVCTLGLAILSLLHLELCHFCPITICAEDCVSKYVNETLSHPDHS